MSEIKITEMEVAKLNLQPGDTLMVKLKGDDFDHQETLESLRNTLKVLFPDNRIMLFSMDKNHEIEFNIIKQGEE